MLPALVKARWLLDSASAATSSPHPKVRCRSQALAAKLPVSPTKWKVDDSWALAWVSAKDPPSNAHVRRSAADAVPMAAAAAALLVGL